MTTRVPPAPGRDRRHRRYSTKTMKLVRDMAAGGWTPAQIRRYLESQGMDTPPHETTILRWTTSEVQTRERLARRAINRRYADRQRAWRDLTANWRERDWRDRMEELRRDAGLTCAAITRVLHHDLGVELTEADVRELLANVPRGTGLDRKKAA